MKKNGFTLVELLISIGIMALLVGVVIASINSSKKKASDVEIKKTVSEIALKAEGQEIAPGVVNYQSALTAVDATTTLSQLATKQGVTQGTDPGSYDYSISATDYAILFPLKKGGYYCVDSYSNATAKEVTGQFQAKGAKTCATATRTTIITNNKPVITLIGNPVDFGVNNGTYLYRGSTVFGIIPADWPEPSYTATDTEDGNITANVLIEYPDQIRMTHLTIIPRNNLVSLFAKVFIPESALAKGGGGLCLGQTERHYYVTDSDGNTGHAYRSFTAVC